MIRRLLSAVALAFCTGFAAFAPLASAAASDPADATPAMTAPPALAKILASDPVFAPCPDRAFLALIVKNGARKLWLTPVTLQSGLRVIVASNGLQCSCTNCDRKVFWQNGDTYVPVLGLQFGRATGRNGRVPFPPNREGLGPRDLSLERDPLRAAAKRTCPAQREFGFDRGGKARKPPRDVQIGSLLRIARRQSPHGRIRRWIRFHGGAGTDRDLVRRSTRPSFRIVFYLRWENVAGRQARTFDRQPDRGHVAGVRNLSYPSRGRGRPIFDIRAQTRDSLADQRRSHRAVEPRRRVSSVSLRSSSTTFRRAEAIR